MRIIYKTNTTYSAAEFGKMNLEIQKHDSKFRKAQYIIAAIIAVIIAICLYNAWYIAAAAMVAVGFAVFLYIIPHNVRKQAEKEFGKSRLEGTPSNMTFYLDHYEEVNKMGRSAYKYVQLRHIYETPTNFYLMLNDKQGAIVEKANCKPELIKFIGKIKAHSTNCKR